MRWLWHIQRRLARLASGRTLVVLSAALATLAVIVATWFPSARLRALAGGRNLPDLQPWRDPRALLAQIESYGETGRHLYLTHVTTVDVVTPMIQMLFLSTIVALILRRIVTPDSRWNLLTVTPLLALVGDYGENAAFAILMAAHPASLDALAQASTGFTALKFGGTAASVTVVVGALAAWAIRVLRTSRHPDQGSTTAKSIRGPQA